MQIDILHRPANAAARLKLGPSESCVAEGGAMIAMSADTAIETTTHQRGGGGFLSGMKRMLGGESFFLNHFTAGPGGGEVWLAAKLSGDMEAVELDNETLIVQGGSFVACDPGVQMDMGWQGMKSLLSGEGLFWLKLSGKGRVVLSSFGAVYPIDVDGEHIVDSGHIVAFQETLDFEITKAGSSWLSSFLGGEGLVCRFKGRGRLWCQSHNSTAFGRLVGPLLKPRR